MHLRLHTLALAAAALLTSCASAPQFRYYTLDMRPSGSVSAAGVFVDTVRPAEALARPDIMIQAAPTEVEYYAAHRWVSGLGEMVREKLQAEFGAPGGERPAYLLNGEILAFGQVDTPAGADAYIKLRVTVQRAGAGRNDPPVLRKVYEHTAAAEAPAAPEVVRALSAGLERVAAAIAEDIRAIPAP